MLYFSKVLFEGLIFEGAYLRREIFVSKSIEPTLIVGSNLLFLLSFTLYLEGRFNGGFLRYRFGGLIFGGAYTWRGLLSKFYDILVRGITHVLKEIVHTKINPAVPFLFGLGSLV